MKCIFAPFLHSVWWRVKHCTLHHELVGVVCDWEQVRGHFHPSLSSVFGDDALCVDGEAAVGVDGHTEKSRVGL